MKNTTNTARTHSKIGSLMLLVFFFLSPYPKAGAQLPNDLPVTLEKLYGGATNHDGFVVRPLPNGGFLLGGNIARSDGRDILLIWTDCSGNELRRRTYTESGDDRLQWAMNNNLQLTSDGGIIMVGTTRLPPRSSPRNILVIWLENTYQIWSLYC